jgi:hypothetical protein
MRKKQAPEYVTCAHCGIRYIESVYSTLSRAIMQHKPACSYECNKALGQAK